MILFGGPFLLLASIPAFFYLLGPAGPLATVGLLLAILIGAEFVAPRGGAVREIPPARAYRVMLYVYVPLQLASIAWGIQAATASGPLGFASLVLAVGVTTGVFGMLAAHELVHSRLKDERLLGAVMLTGMAYRHFRIAHVHFHHRLAATEADSATARLGEGFYAFLLRTVPGQFREAWRFEAARCRDRAPFANRVIGDVAAIAIVVAAVFAFWGVAGAGFFLAQAAVGVVVLELFNYIAHYGLVRSDAGGRAEPLVDRHSWNSSNVLVNRLIFNMGRHSWHHRKPAASYQTLQYLSAAPELPAGYAGSILLALVPPLWRRVMDARALALRVPADIRLAA
jgi:alkane 1-monooxygenase